MERVAIDLGWKKQLERDKGSKNIAAPGASQPEQDLSQKPQYTAKSFYSLIISVSLVWVCDIPCGVCSEVRWSFPSPEQPGCYPQVGFGTYASESGVQRWQAHDQATRDTPGHRDIWHLLQFAFAFVMVWRSL